MSTIAAKHVAQSPEIVVGKDECRKVTIAALTEVRPSGEPMDFLLYELDRARIVPDTMVPADVVRLGSIVRYRPVPGGEQRTLKLVMPDEVDGPGGYRLSVTSLHGAALLGLRAGAAMSWLEPNGTTQHVEVLGVINPDLNGA